MNTPKIDLADELKIQRCADGELTPVERAQLLSALEAAGQIEGWRLLALTFVENQVFSTSFEQVEESFVTRERPVVTQSLWRRRIHPNTVIASSLLVIALVTVVTRPQLQNDGAQQQLVAQEDQLLSDQVPHFMQVANPGQQPVFASPAFEQYSTSSLRPPVAGPGYSQSPSGPSPAMQVSLASLNGERPAVSLPVYGRDQWSTVQNQIQPNRFSPQMKQVANDEGLQLNRAFRWYRARLDDGREVYVPAEQTTVLPAIQ